MQRWDELDAFALGDGGEFFGRYSIRGQSDFSTLEIWKFASASRAHEFWERRVEGSYSRFFAFSNQLGLSLPGPGGGSS